METKIRSKKNRFTSNKNQSPRQIKIQHEQTHCSDRMGGHLWQTKPHLFINERNVLHKLNTFENVHLFDRSFRSLSRSLALFQSLIPIVYIVAVIIKLMATECMNLVAKPISSSLSVGEQSKFIPYNVPTTQQKREKCMLHFIFCPRVKCETI